MQNIINQALTFIYSIAHWVGAGVFKIINWIFPKADIPNNIIDALGFLAILTVFLLLADTARKVLWIILGVGWALILVRILMVLVK
jgi:hypothetical protein